jgi:glycosyltransferase involved in cell wall biosynthesis
MRIAFASLRTSRHADGPGTRRFERVARTLSKLGHEVTLFCGQFWNDYTDEWVEDGLRYRGVTLGTAPASFATRLPALLARYGPDVVHVRQGSSRGVLAALSGARLARVPLVAEYVREAPAGGRLAGLAARAPDHVVTPSDLVWADARESGTDPERLSVVPQSVDYDLLESVEPAEDVDIVCTHRLDDSANLEDVLLALAELRWRDWRAVVVGEGPRRAAYEQTAEELRIGDKVEFVGELDLKRRIALYRGAHVFVHTATEERFATELLRALACGCVGVVEYQEHSSAPELVKSDPRGIRISEPWDLGAAIAGAADHDRLDLDERWRSHENAAIAERYLDTYAGLE